MCADCFVNLLCKMHWLKEITVFYKLMFKLIRNSICRAEMAAVNCGLRQGVLLNNYLLYFFCREEAPVSKM